jgi:hypothetical protein
MGIRVFNSEFEPNSIFINPPHREVSYDYPTGTHWETDLNNLIVWADDAVVAEFRSSKWDRVETYV